MNLLIDTNVILDVLLKREPFYDDAARISLLSEKGYVRNYVSASAVTDIFYILKKKLRSRDAAFELLRIILKTTRIVSVTADSIY